MKKIILAAFLLTVAFTACSRKKTYSWQELPETQVRFGKGGGIVGRETFFVLLENGQLFNSTGAELPKVKAKAAKKCFKAIQDAGLMQMTPPQPGNIYTFIELPDGSSWKRWAWSPGRSAEGDVLKSLHQQLMELTQTVDNSQ